MMGGKIKIGNNVFFNSNCIIASHQEINIGDDTSFGPNVVIFDHDHDYKNIHGKKSGKYKKDSIKIGKNVWVGANSIILRGVRIGDNAVIAAGTTVREDIDKNVIYYSKVNNIQKEYKKYEEEGKKDEDNNN